MRHHPIDEGHVDLSSFLTHWILAVARGRSSPWFDLTGQEVAHQWYSRTQDAQMGDAMILCDKGRVVGGWTDGLKWPSKVRIERPMGRYRSENLWSVSTFQLDTSMASSLTYSVTTDLSCKILWQREPGLSLYQICRFCDEKTVFSCWTDVSPTLCCNSDNSFQLPPSLLPQSTFVIPWPQASWITSSLGQGSGAQLVRWFSLWICQALWWERNPPAGTRCSVLLCGTSVAP